MNFCRKCNSQQVELLREPTTLNYKGNAIEVPICYYVCRNCGHEFIPAELIQINDAAFRNEKKRVDGLLLSNEIAAARAQLGITQEQASMIFGGGRNAFSKYERNEVSQSLPMDKLLRTCVRHPEVFRDLALAAGVEIAAGSIVQKVSSTNYVDSKPKPNTNRFRQIRTTKILERCYG